MAIDHIFLSFNPGLSGSCPSPGWEKGACPDPASVLIETFRALLIVGDTALQLSQFILGAPRFKQQGGHNTRDAALVSSGSSRKPVLLSTR